MQLIPQSADCLMHRAAPLKTGELVMPCFPFHSKWKRGKIRFSSAQLVPHGESYLIMPAAFEGRLSFREAAVFQLTFLPWPWGNMSIALKTIKDGDTAERAGVHVVRVPDGGPGQVEIKCGYLPHQCRGPCDAKTL
ncbi:hypothetical protein MTO96_043524 [Rhipicephalus appendiculatus]